MSDRAEYYHLNAKLCRLIEANPLMYDRSAPNYYKKEAVECAWAEIAHELNDTVASCKERWRNIRTAFARSVNIYKTSSGPNRHKRYYLHDELQFLTKHLAYPTLRFSAPSELDEVNPSEDNCTIEIALDSSSSPPPIQEKNQETIQEELLVPIPKLEPKTEPKPEPERNYVESSPQARKRQRNNSQEFQIVSKSQKTDPDCDFLNILLPEMKAMNSRQKILFKGKIFQALEEVFSDPKDFPRIEEPLGSQSSSLASGAPRTYARRFFGNKNGADRREKLPGETPQTGRAPIMLQSAPPDNENITIKLEMESVEIDD